MPQAKKDGISEPIPLAETIRRLSDDQAIIYFAVIVIGIVVLVVRPVESVTVIFKA